MKTENDYIRILACSFVKSLDIYLQISKVKNMVILAYIVKSVDKVLTTQVGTPEFHLQNPLKDKEQCSAHLYSKASGEMKTGGSLGFTSHSSFVYLSPDHSLFHVCSLRGSCSHQHAFTLLLLLYSFRTINVNKLFLLQIVYDLVLYCRNRKMTNTSIPTFSVLLLYVFNHSHS